MLLGKFKCKSIDILGGKSICNLFNNVIKYKIEFSCKICTGASDPGPGPWSSANCAILKLKSIVNNFFFK